MSAIFRNLLFCFLILFFQEGVMAAEGWSPPTCNYSCPVAGPAINSCQCLSAHSEKDYNKYLSDHSYQCNGSFGGSPINNNGISFFVTHEKEWHLIPLTVQKEKEIFYYQKGTCRYVSYCLNQEGKYVKKRPLIIHVIWDEDCNIAPASVLQNLGNSSGNSGNFGNLVNENGKLLMSNP